MTRRLTSTLAIVVVVTAVIGFGDRPALRAQTPPSLFRSGVDVVSLSVTVNNADRKYVGDLNRDDFLVLENGVAQQVTYFARTAVPLTLALLIDSSASMEQAMVTAQEAAAGFVRTLTPADTAAIVDFDSRVEMAQGFTSDVRALEEAILRTTAGGATAMFNAIYITLKELAKKIAPEEAQDPGAVRSSCYRMATTPPALSASKRRSMRRRVRTPPSTPLGWASRTSQGHAHATRKARSSCAGWRSKPAAAPSFLSKPRTSPTSIEISAKSSRASIPWRTSRAAREKTASGDASPYASIARASRSEPSRATLLRTSDWLQTRGHQCPRDTPCARRGVPR